MKFSLNPITAQKIANFQNTVRRLKIILLSLFFWLIIRASIWSPHGKNLADPRYEQKDDHIAKYCYKPRHLRIDLVFLYLSSKGHFGTLTLKLLLNPITKETMTNLQNTVKRLKHCHKPFIFISSFPSSYFVLPMIVTFWSFYGKILAEPYYCPKNNQIPKQSQTPQNNPS